MLEKIAQLKSKLQNQVAILGHHYQQDDIIRFADFRGDSLDLARRVAKIDKPYIIFCGVHFMAETADMLTLPSQSVILPDLAAGCSMADMADLADVEVAWDLIAKSTPEKIVPITYINCSAELKAFVGRHGGSICTSSNAKRIIEWAFREGKKLLFFPDQHLGRNTCYAMGIPLSKMCLYDPRLPGGGLGPGEIEKARVILWYGLCSVHQNFTLEQIVNVRKNHPQMKVLVHPECNFDVVQNSDFNGSTAYIIKTVSEAKSGSQWAVGTEINLVKRLALEHPDKKIVPLSPFPCLCSTMYRIRPECLLQSLEAIDRGSPVNIIKVPEMIRKDALKALTRMLAL